MSYFLPNGILKDSFCSVIGCEEFKKKRGYCKKHYSFFYNKNLRCVYPDCTKKPRIKKMCRKHYNQEIERLPEKEKESSNCTIDGCKEKSFYNQSGLCKLHYRLNYQKQRKCVCPNCKKKPKMNDMCIRHFKQIIEERDLQPIR